MSLADVVELLACPVCAAPVELASPPRSLRCVAGHSFDVARSGYVNLARSAPPANADTPAMVAARQRFLARGRYAPVADGIVAAAHLAMPAAVLDCGAGTGYHLARVLAAWPGARGVALDVSPAAARRAASAHPRLGAVVADVWERLPVADGAVDLVLSVFAPRRADEFSRVLAPGGQLLTVTPTARHLRELRAELALLDIQPDKQGRLAAALREHFEPAQEEEVTVTERWEADAVREVVAMGPNAFHPAAPDLAELAGTRDVTVSVRVSRWLPLSAVRGGR